MSWIHESVIYQINLRSLAAREPRNAIEATQEFERLISPLAYVTANLETIAGLGVSVLYLLPPYPIGKEGRKGIGSPYSSRDFMAVEPEYGTLDELCGFIQKAHEYGLRVIFDITPNHTARDHVWTVSHPDYYVRSDNGELFYDFDWSDVAKLDYHNPQLRRAMIEVYDFWLSILGVDDDGTPQGIDGFRLDMAHMISDLGFWNDAMSELHHKYASRELLFLAESYGTQTNMKLFDRGINAAYDDDFYKLCQYFYAVDANGNTVIDESPEAACNVDFSDKLEAFRSGGMAGAALRCILNYEEAYETGASPLVARYTDNHDEGRGLHRFGAGGVMAMNRLLFMSSHCIPFLLTGQEFGAVNRPSIHERLGICDKGPRVIDGDNRHELLPGIEFEGNLFARQPSERKRWYCFYQELIRLRKNHPELIYGDFKVIEVGEDCDLPTRTVVAFERRYAGKVLRCAINMGADSRRLLKSQLFDAPCIYGERLDDGVLPPFSAIAVAV